METESMPEEAGLPYPFGSLRDILTTLFRHKIKIVAVFLAIFLGVAGWVFSSIPYFESRASIVLKFGREHIVRPEVGTGAENVIFNQDTAVKTELNILSSRDLARRVVATVGAHVIYPELVDSLQPVSNVALVEFATSIFSRNLTSKHVAASNVIEISFFHPDPVMAAIALNTLIDLLREKHLQVFSDPKASFLTSQLNNYQNKLEDSERKLQAFKHKQDIFSSLVQQ